MKDIRLLKAIGAADDDLIAEYEADTGTKTAMAGRSRRYIAAAACLCLVIAGALALRPLMSEAPAGSDDSLSKISSAPGGEDDGNNHVVIDRSDTDMSSSGCYVAPGAGETLFFVELRDMMEKYAGTEVEFFLQVDILVPDEAALEYGSEEHMTEVERLVSLGYDLAWYESWTYHGQGEKIAYTYLAGLFTIDELENFQASELYGYSFSFQNYGDGTPVEFDADLFSDAASKVIDRAEWETIDGITFFRIA